MLLLEAPLDGAPSDVFHDAADELERRGYGLVVGHPERSPNVLAEPERLAARRARGARLQVNASSIIGAHGERAQRDGIDLIRRGEATLLASDAHRPARPAVLSPALEVLAHHDLDGRPLVDETPLQLLRRGIEPARHAA